MSFRSLGEEGTFNQMLQSLNLLNFRNHLQASFQFSQPINIFLGPNAIGKTNLLESIALLATGKSFKTSKSEDMINFNQEFSRISGDLTDDSLELLLTRGIYQGKRVARKKYLVNGVAKSIKNFAFKFYVVTFKPQDIQVVTGSPSSRRQLLDFVLAQVDWQYQACLTVYTKGLRQRNKLLSLIRDNKANYSQLEYFNRLILKNGVIIQKKRQELIEFLNQYTLDPVFVNNYSAKVIDKLKNFSFSYDPSIISPDRLLKYKQAEIATANTLIGPHRDDFIFLYNLNNTKKDLAAFASRGQQRLAVLSLKLGQSEFIQVKTEQTPILLLDDIFSELDADNDQIVMDIIQKHTSFITTTQLDTISDKLENTEVFKLK